MRAPVNTAAFAEVSAPDHDEHAPTQAPPTADRARHEIGGHRLGPRHAGEPEAAQVRPVHEHVEHGDGEDAPHQRARDASPGPRISAEMYAASFHPP